MKFNLTRPCANCPFLSRPQNQGRSGRERAKDIIEVIVDRQGTFICHKTDRRIQHNQEAQHCAGALIMLEHMNQPSQMMRITARIGQYDPSRLRMDTHNVVNDGDEFIELHTRL